MTPSIPEQAAEETRAFKWGKDYGKDLLTDINALAHAKGTGALFRDVLRRAHVEISRLTAAAAPLLGTVGREKIIETVENIYEVNGSAEDIADAILSLRPALPAPAGWQPPKGWKLVPEKITPEIACALEGCAPPSAWVHGDPHGAIDELMRVYQDEWTRALAAAPAPADPKEG